MVRALLDGHKTQTRRLAALKNGSANPMAGWRVGDRLYVREAHAVVGAVDPGWVLYRASGYLAECERHGFDKPYPLESEVRWRPSIHMPRWASRLTLIVENIRTHELQRIHPEDAKAEGWSESEAFLPATWFRNLWDSLHDKRGERWMDNPLVVALTFRVEHGNVDTPARRSP
tara:strand:- start:164 stop:682 length:519 start_codon:yes stop_codon:yes gene_type:complete